ncbi:MAG: metallophosphatase family protein [Cyclobacteriaceae bacterium]|nr:metallophosphoesterase family protein [Cyclobacteriaceae bacterium]MCH8515443.1 metallophosphatase family protein [Cyclobacteriaceae bacterium]
MKICLLSDTHGYWDEQLEKYADSADEIWHAGDVGDGLALDALNRYMKKTVAVYGNIDSVELRSQVPESVSFERSSCRIFMTHILGKPGKYKASSMKFIKEYLPNIVICGHSHILHVSHNRQLKHLHLNPGAVGRQGFHAIRTLLTFDLSAHGINNLCVIELGKRATLVK